MQDYNWKLLNANEVSPGLSAAALVEAPGIFTDLHHMTEESFLLSLTLSHSMSHTLCVAHYATHGGGV
jgi:hypothetical protein